MGLICLLLVWNLSFICLFVICFWFICNLFRLQTRSSPGVTGSQAPTSFPSVATPGLDRSPTPGFSPTPGISTPGISPTQGLSPTPGFSFASPRVAEQLLETSLPTQFPEISRKPTSFPTFAGPTDFSAFSRLTTSPFPSVGSASIFSRPPTSFPTQRSSSLSSEGNSSTMTTSLLTSTLLTYSTVKTLPTEPTGCSTMHELA